MKGNKKSATGRFRRKALQVEGKMPQSLSQELV
jgi:hypothetical protein